MPRRMMDRRMMRDGRNPYGSQGGYVTSDRAGRGNRTGRSGGMSNRGSSRDYVRGGRDMARNGRNDGHYGRQGQMYRPIEAMGYFNGYYGEDMNRGRDYGNYERNSNRDYGYNDYGYEDDYGYYEDEDDYYGDYGEKLGKEELEKWNKKLMKELEEKDKAMFTKQNITQKARQMGIQMEEFSEDELLTTTLMMYTDYCKALKPYVGNNMDIYVSMAKAFLTDKDAMVKGGEKLAIYYDNIVVDEEDDD